MLMEAKNAETQNDKPKGTAYTEEEIFALIEFAWTDSIPDLCNRAYPGRTKGNLY